MKNPKCQFEIISDDVNFINDAYKWCVNNLNLKEEKRLIYNPESVYIITGNQKIIDKVNKYFGSSFSFENFWDTFRFYKIEIIK